MVLLTAILMATTGTLTHFAGTTSVLLLCVFVTMNVVLIRLKRGGQLTPFSRPLTRSRFDRMVTGVCGGVAQYLNIDPTIVRTLSVLVMCFTAILPGLAAYIVLSFVIPKATET